MTPTQTMHRNRGTYVCLKFEPPKVSSLMTPWDTETFRKKNLRLFGIWMNRIHQLLRAGTSTKSCWLLMIRQYWLKSTKWFFFQLYVIWPLPVKGPAFLGTWGFPHFGYRRHRGKAPGNVWEPKDGKGRGAPQIWVEGSSTIDLYRNPTKTGDGWWFDDHFLKIELWDKDVSRRFFFWLAEYVSTLFVSQLLEGNMFETWKCAGPVLTDPAHI